MYVTGTPRIWLRLEGAALLAASVVAYCWQLGGWTTFAALFLAPDLTMLGYLAGPATGARLYNLAHNEVAPIFLAMYGIGVGRHDVLPYALIWLAHIGFDRLLGLGLKYPTRFQHTHLGPIGRATQE
jgi:hypothetical protein